MLRKLLKVEAADESGDRLIIMVGFSIAAIACLTVLEVFHLIILGAWNPEIFAAITGLLGHVLGIIMGRRM